MLRFKPKDGENLLVPDEAVGGVSLKYDPWLAQEVARFVEQHATSSGSRPPAEDVPAPTTPSGGSAQEPPGPGGGRVARRLDPMVSGFLEGWGGLIAGLNVFGILFGIIGIADGHAISGVVTIAISFALVWPGYAVHKREKRGIAAICVVAALGVLGCLAIAIRSDLVIATVYLGVLALFYGPAIVVGLRNWDALD